MKKNLSLTLFVILITSITSCDRKLKTSLDENPEFAKYISAHTSGIVSKRSGIKVVVNFSLKESQDIDLNELFEVDPDVTGNVSILNDRTLFYNPDKDLKSNTLYKVTFKLGDIVDVSEELEDFIFEFRTIKPAFSVSTYGVHINNDNKSAYVT